MEHFSESLLRQSLTARSADPYSVAHALLHWAARFGRVIERENRLLTTGPRTSATVKFYIERNLDKFTHLHAAFDMAGDMATATLSVTFEATLECSLPTAHGIATSAFRDVYLARIWPAHLRLARDTAKNLLESMRQQLATTPGARSTIS